MYLNWTVSTNEDEARDLNSTKVTEGKFSASAGRPDPLFPLTDVADNKNRTAGSVLHRDGIPTVRNTISVLNQGAPGTEKPAEVRHFSRTVWRRR